ncbi:hypothetical protein MA16_Dca021487 [Dendrobium catenatum]|uniref:Uncharacterized protein n=1 Tax=Dendrobium catenatum TaxID=906689 RepID=A0A2I0WZ89_9ASPA|nr:hypothetical protein MA16_Dca021487 [Dendrobium catenatum]
METTRIWLRDCAGGSEGKSRAGAEASASKKDYASVDGHGNGWMHAVASGVDGGHGRSRELDKHGHISQVNESIARNSAKVVDGESCVEISDGMIAIREQFAGIIARRWNRSYGCQQDV